MTAAVMVIYQPEIALLDKVLNSIVHQVDTVFVVDNTMIPSRELASLFQIWSESIRYIHLGVNSGLATAQNTAIRECLNDTYSHILLLDQDSICSPDLMEKLLQAEHSLIADGVQVAAVGPLFVDRKTNQLSYAVRYDWFRIKKIYIDPSNQEPVEADWLIASGALIRTSVFEEIGAMKDDLFIDLVDAEWGLRARNKGFKSFIIPNAVMDHSIGDDSKKVLGYTFALHNTARNYYIVRNSTYLLRPQKMSWKWATAMILKIPKHIAVHSWYSSSRWHSFRVMVSAALDGIRGRLGPISDQKSTTIT